MTRCPNCGSAIRIGAKFCTSCGFRLTVGEPASSPAATSRSPFATTSSPAWSADPTERDEAVAPTVAPLDEAPEEEDEPAWSKAGGSDPAEDEPAWATTSANDAAAIPSDDEDDSNHQPGPSWMSPVSERADGPISDDMLSSLEEEPADQLQADIADESDREEAVPPDAIPPAPVNTTTYAWDAGDHQIRAVRDEAPTSDGAPGNGGVSTPPMSGDALDEARSLAARLTEVLAGVSAAGAPARGGAGTVTSIADEADVESLWGVVRSAQERPRDVDVMLDLVLRAETIAAVLTDRQVLLAALRGDEAAVEESWPEENDEQDEPSTYPAWGS